MVGRAAVYGQDCRLRKAPEQCPKSRRILILDVAAQSDTTDIGKELAARRWIIAKRTEHF